MVDQLDQIPVPDLELLLASELVGWLVELTARRCRDVEVVGARVDRMIDPRAFSFWSWFKTDKR